MRLTKLPINWLVMFRKIVEPDLRLLDGSFSFTFSSNLVKGVNERGNVSVSLVSLDGVRKKERFLYRLLLHENVMYYHFSNNFHFEK